jgi:uncharacterized protein YxjI
MTDTRRVDDLFSSPVLRIEQPRKILAPQAQYDIFDADGKAVAVAEETDVRTRGQVLKAALPVSPPPGAQVLLVRGPDGEPRLVLHKHEGNRLTEVSRIDGTPVGRIRAQRTTRHYTLSDAENQTLGEVTGDLSLRKFTVADAKGAALGHVTKKWAGLAKEVLTTADRYVVDISDTAREPLRTLIVMTAIMLDLTLHENLGGR